MARRRSKPKNETVQELHSPAPTKTTGSPRSIWRSFVRFYLIGATIYFFWTLTLLQFRECGIFSGKCEQYQGYADGSIILNILTAIFPEVVVYSVSIAFFRALVWLPNLIIELLKGEPLTWLLLRDVPPMQVFLAIMANILP